MQLNWYRCNHASMVPCAEVYVVVILVPLLNHHFARVIPMIVATFS